MSVLGGLLNRRNTARDPADWMLEAFGGATTASGVRVTAEGALGIPSVYAAVGLVSETIGHFPVKLLRTKDGKKDEDRAHPLWTVLHDLPNPELTAIEMRSAQQGHLMLRGNAYAEIERDTSGRVKALWPFRPDLMTVTRDKQKRIVYLYRLPHGGDVKWTWNSATTQPAPILHVRGFGYDGLCGYSPLTLHRETFGLAKAAEEQGARFFSNAARPSGVLKAPGELSDEARLRLKTAWDATTRGLSNAHRVAVLEQGIEWQQISLTPEDSQMLQTMRDVDARIAAIFRVPPHMIGQVERSTSWGSGIEQQNIMFLQFSLMPWLVRWQQAMARDLLSIKGYATHQIRFNVRALLRGDMATQSTFLQTMLDRGVYSINEARGYLDENTIGPDGDLRYVQGNMMPLGATVDASDDDRPAPTGPEPEGVM
jgi:HK97 family phage portal protein